MNSLEKYIKNKHEEMLDENGDICDRKFCQNFDEIFNYVKNSLKNIKCLKEYIGVEDVTSPNHIMDIIRYLFRKLGSIDHLISNDMLIEKGVIMPYIYFNPIWHLHFADFHNGIHIGESFMEISKIVDEVNKVK